MYEIFADLHVHIGRSESGKPVKITGARSLNFANIAKECVEKKGINVVGIIDCASPYVIEDIENFLQNGDAYELKDGGIIYKDKVCILLGSEVETSEVSRNGKCGAAHNVCFFPHLSDIKAFSEEMSHHIKNITLSTQRSDVSGYELIDIVEKYNGILIPAHIFTPHKSYYGNCTDRLENIFKEKLNKIFAVELGLSADTFLADTISELERMTFVTNSDAHSLPKIAREYNLDVASKKDSEDICFIPDNDYVRFLTNYGKLKLKSGNIVLKDGTKLGNHNGLIKYTIGQRRGLGIAYKEPLYVTKLDKENNETIHTTLPLGIIVVRDDYFITVSLKQTRVISDLKQNSIVTYKKSRSILQIFYKNSELFLRELKKINKEFNVISKSKIYKNSRGSKYSRVYLDIENKEEK